MLSMANVAASDQAASYYEETDDYYSRQSEELAPSRWSGQAALALNLHGEVEVEDFRMLLRGDMPDGGKVHVGGGQRRGGTDLTLSAPKSVSIQALVVGDTRLIEAHDRAVRRTLTYAEERTRTRSNELTGNLAIASFLHTTNRNADPQLHTHNVVVNATLTAGGRWRALDNKWLFDMKMELGAMYRAELAREIRALGYSITKTNKDGRFELAHFTREQVKAFATRSRDVEAVLAARGLTRDTASATQKAAVTRSSRMRKRDVDRDVLTETWRRKAAQLGIALTMPGQSGANQGRGPRNPHWYRDADPLGGGDAHAAGAAVDYALAHLTEREAVVQMGHVRRFALEHGIGDVRMIDVEAELDRRIREGRVLVHGNELTTRKMLSRERDILRRTEAGAGALRRPVVDHDVLERTLRSSAFTAGQRDALRTILTADDRVVGVRGRAGTGKTTMLADVRRLAESEGFKLLGLGPSGRAVAELRNAGIGSSCTIARFNLDAGRQLDDRTVVVVDEAGMVSARDMRHILHRVEQSGARAVLIGDERQLKPVEAGRPFEQVLQAGMRTALMSEIQRQLGERYRASVALAAEGRMDAALAKVAHNVRAIADDAERYSAIARGYLQLPAAERAGTMVVSGTNEARHAINRAIRDELGLTTVGERFVRLARVDLTRAQAKAPNAYKRGMVVEAERAYQGFGIAKGDRLRVEGLDAANGTVLLRHVDGRLIRWQPRRHTNFSAYWETKIGLAVGDRVQFSKGDDKAGIRNRDFAELICVDGIGRVIGVRLTDGREVQLDGTRALHLDYGYASTIHAAQGATVRRIIVDLDTRARTTNDAAFYVALSRGREALRIYTNDLQGLPAAIKRASRKSAAMDILDKQGQAIPAPHQRATPPERAHQARTGVTSTLTPPQRLRD